MAALVVIPVYGDWDHARGLVAQLEDGTSRGDFDVVVVDDHSRDSGAQELKKEYPDIIVVERNVNGGFAAAVNTGLRAKDWDVAATLNSDLRIDAHVVAQLLEMARDNPNTILGPRVVSPKGTVDLPRAGFHTSGSLSLRDNAIIRWAGRRSPRLRRQIMRWRKIDVEAMDATAPKSTGWLVGACLVFHRSVVDRIGYLDEGYHMYAEDMDWQRRADAHGVDRVYVPFLQAFHEKGHGAARGSGAGLARERRKWRADFLFILRTGGRARLVMLRLALLLSGLVNVLGLVFRSVMPYKRTPPNIGEQIKFQLRRPWLPVAGGELARGNVRRLRGGETGGRGAA